MDGFDDQPLDQHARRRGPSGARIGMVVALWLVGLPAMVFVGGLFALGAGFAADAGGGSSPGAAFGIVALIGLVGLVGLSALVLGGADDEPMEPPAPYAGTPLSKVPAVTASWPAKRHTRPTPEHDA